MFWMPDREIEIGNGYRLLHWYCLGDTWALVKNYNERVAKTDEFTRDQEQEAIAWARRIISKPEDELVKSVKMLKDYFMKAADMQEVPGPAPVYECDLCSDKVSNHRVWHLANGNEIFLCGKCFKRAARESMQSWCGG